MGIQVNTSLGSKPHVFRVRRLHWSTLWMISQKSDSRVTLMLPSQQPLYAAQKACIHAEYTPQIMYPVNVPLRVV
jgi:hypothetical protein